MIRQLKILLKLTVMKLSELFQAPDAITPNNIDFLSF